MEMKFTFDEKQLQEIATKAVLELGGVGFAGCQYCPHRDELTGLCYKVLETFGSEIYTEKDSPCIWFAPEEWRSKEEEEDAAN